jgi:glucose/arabinose dehydrogenase
MRAVRLAAVAGLVLLAACGSDAADTTVTGPAVTFATQPPNETVAPNDTADTTVAPPATVGTAPATTGPVAVTEPAATEPAPTEPATTAPLGDPVIALEPIAVATAPVDVAWRTGDDTIYVVEQDGLIRPIRDGVLGDPVLDITDLTTASGEQGLLGLTFSPDGSFAYLDHTDNDGNTDIVEYAVAADGTFDPSSRRVLLEIDQPYGNHNGGNVAIGPDGMLYIGMGDGGSANDPERRALNVSSLLGKILRIDPAPGDGVEYTVPADNPFVDVAGAQPEIWAVGVRNPWRFSFDSATGDLWIADVGQNEFEEIDVAWAADGGGRGLNFGWSAWEASTRFNDDQPEDGVTFPIYEYPHGDEGCSVSGGAVARGTAVPALAGWYVFADYCSGRLTGLRMDGRDLADSLPLGQLAQATAVRASPDGDLYVTSAAGDIVRIVAG